MIKSHVLYQLSYEPSPGRTVGPAIRVSLGVEPAAVKQLLRNPAKTGIEQWSDLEFRLRHAFVTVKGW